MISFKKYICAFYNHALLTFEMFVRINNQYIRFLFPIRLYYCSIPVEDRDQSISQLVIPTNSRDRIVPLVYTISQRIFYNRRHIQMLLEFIDRMISPMQSPARIYVASLFIVQYWYWRSPRTLSRDTPIRSLLDLSEQSIQMHLILFWIYVYVCDAVLM